MKKFTLNQVLLYSALCLFIPIFISLYIKESKYDIAKDYLEKIRPEFEKITSENEGTQEATLLVYTEPEAVITVSGIVDTEHDKKLLTDFLKNLDSPHGVRTDMIRVREKVFKQASQN